MSDSTSARAWNPRYAYGALVLLFALFALNYFHRQIIAILMPDIAQDLALSDTQVGALSGIGFTLFYAASTIPLARIADGGHRRAVIAACVAVWSLLTAAAGAAQSFVQIMLARVGMGVAEAGYGPSANALLAAYFPPHRLGGATALHASGATLGVFLAFGLGGALAEAFGWRTALAMAGLPGLALGVVAYVVLREPAREAAGEQTHEKVGLARLFTLQWFLMLLLAASAAAFSDATTLSWYAMFAARTFGIDAQAEGWTIGLVISAASGLGLLAGGFAVDWLIKRDRRWLAWLPALSCAAGAPAFLATYLAPSFQASVVALALPAFLSGVYYAPSITTIQLYAPASHRATALALFFAAFTGLGYGFAPFMVGVASDMLEPSAGAASLRFALLGVPIVLCIAAFAFWFVGQRLQTDEAHAAA